MAEIILIINAVIAVFVVIGSGFFLRKLEWLSSQADSSLLRLTINLFIPALILDSVLGNEALKSISNVAIPPIIGFSSVAIGVGLAWLTSKWIKSSHPKSRGTFSFCVGMYNYGYIPIPLVISFFDKQTLGVLFVHNLGVEAAFWIFSSLMLAWVSIKESIRKLFTPPLLTIIAGVFLNCLGFSNFIPQAILQAIHMVGQCAIPIGMILIGATVADQLKDIDKTIPYRTIIWAIVLRIILIPFIFITIAYILPVSIELKRVIVIQAAMPSAVFPIVVTKYYSGDTNTALWVVISTSTVAIVTIPIWLQIGLRFIS